MFGDIVVVGVTVVVIVVVTKEVVVVTEVVVTVEVAVAVDVVGVIVVVEVTVAVVVVRYGTVVVSVDVVVEVAVTVLAPTNPINMTMLTPVMTIITATAIATNFTEIALNLFSAEDFKSLLINILKSILKILKSIEKRFPQVFQLRLTDMRHHLLSE